ncbi:MAG TPA: hypothetical protein VN696_17490 [Pyrinomonadaceae bacterium]|nr:hypothetical protein [Pyrinomonadaceae bacterium]
MKNDLYVNQTPEAENQSVSEVPVAQTSTPHFDDIAVAIAQPVQPLTKPHPGRASSATIFRSLLLALVACVMVATLATAVSLFGLPRHETTANAPVAAPSAEAIPTDTLGGNLEANESIEPQRRRAQPRRRLARGNSDRILLIQEDDEGKPAARKVGEIRGRGSDRP